MRRRLAIVCLLTAAAPALAAPRAPAPLAASHAQAARLKGEVAQLRAQLVQLGAVEAGGERSTLDKKARLEQLNAE